MTIDQKLAKLYKLTLLHNIYVIAQESNQRTVGIKWRPTPKWAPILTFMANFLTENTKHLRFFDLKLLFFFTQVKLHLTLGTNICHLGTTRKKYNIPVEEHLEYSIERMWHFNEHCNVPYEWESMYITLSINNLHYVRSLNFINVSFSIVV